MERLYINKLIKEALKRKISVINGLYSVILKNKEISVNNNVYEIFDIGTGRLLKLPVTAVERIFDL